MKIILQTSRVDGHLSQAPGDCIDVPDDVARRMIDSGQARYANGGSKTETAMLTQGQRGQRQTRAKRKANQ